jgi:hypothetical protein
MSIQAQNIRVVHTSRGSFIPTQKKDFNDGYLKRQSGEEDVFWVQFSSKTAREQWLMDKAYHVQVVDVLEDENYAIVTNASQLKNWVDDDRIAAVFDIPPIFKVEKSIVESSDYEKMELKVSLYGHFSFEEFQKLVYPYSILSMHNAGNMTYAVISSDHSGVMALAAQARVRSIAHNVKNCTPINFHVRFLEGIQGANAGIEVGGLGLNGKGITIGHGDTGGFEHIDLDDRVIDLGLDSMTRHAPHTAGTMIGAGNIQEKHRGAANEAHLINTDYYDIISRDNTFYKDFEVRVTNNSYAVLEKNIDCNSMGEYNIFSEETDQSTVLFPDLLHVWASGNSGTIVCDSLIPSLNSVLSGPQCNKNGLTVGAIWRREGTPVTEFSCKGPTDDGRIKPEIVAQGTNVTSCSGDNNYYTTAGTSMSAPSVTGTVALMQEAYKKTHGGLYPLASLIKAFLINTADDLLGEGPEFSNGYGKVNTMKAATEAGSDRNRIGQVEQNQIDTFMIIVPPNQAKAVFTLAWTDISGSSLATRQLVNDLDLVVKSPQGDLLPWTLNPSSSHALESAVRGIDSLNNLEQVSILHPEPGEYTIVVKGKKIIGMQQYAVCYRTENKKMKILGPYGGEKVIPGEFIYMQWESPYDTGDSTTVSLSFDDGQSWQVIGVKADSLRTHYFVIPQVSTGKARWMISSGQMEGDTSGLFTICPPPGNFKVNAGCRGEVDMQWSPVNGAVGYNIYYKNGDYMQKVDYTTDTTFVLKELDPSKKYWVSVSAVLTDGSEGRRALALSVTPIGLHCDRPKDVAILSISSPARIGREGTVLALTDHEKVSILVANKGSEPATEFKVNFSLGDIQGAKLFSDTIAPGDSVVITFDQEVDLSRPDNYLLHAAIDLGYDPPYSDDNQMDMEIRQLKNEALTLTFDLLDTYHLGFDDLGRRIAHNGAIGALGINEFDFISNNKNGRARSQVTSDFYMAGDGALTIDSRYAGAAVSNQALFTFNLSQYSTLDNVKMDISYLCHNASFLENKSNSTLWLRGSDQEEWIPLYDVTAQTNQKGVYSTIKGLELSKALIGAGQSFSTSTQLKIEQTDYSPASSPDGYGGFSYDELYIYLTNQDTKVSKINFPEPNSCGLTKESQLAIEVENTSSSHIDKAQLWYNIDGVQFGPQEVLNLAGGERRTVSTPAVDLSAIGEHTIDVWLDTEGDTYRKNDSLLKYKVYNHTYIQDFPYLATFEQDDNQWLVSGYQSSWIRAKPQKQKLDGAANGQYAMVTSSTGRYNGFEKSYLTSPCIDLSRLQSPNLSFSFWYQIETRFDSCMVEYSENGIDWKIMGTSQSGFHWYNREKSWDGHYDYWHVAGMAMPKDSMTDATQVRIRFSLFSDENVQMGGIAIDDIHIYDGSSIYGGEDSTVSISILPTWQDVMIGGSVVASVKSNTPKDQDLKINVYFNHDAEQRHDGVQYYLDRSFSIHSLDNIEDSIVVRLFFTDEEVERLIHADSLYHKPQHGYQLGVTRILSDNNDGIFGNEISAVATFQNYQSTQLTPYQEGYYIEFKTAGVGEYYINTGGAEFNLPLGNKTIRNKDVVNADIGCIIYPNPFNTQLTVKLKAAKKEDDYWLKLMDTQGRTLRQEYVKGSVLSEGKVFKADVPSGVYILKIEHNGVSFFRKIVAIKG